MSLRQSRPAAGTHDRPRPDGPERLQKVLAAAGLGSRRHCEELILAGRVEVDGQIVSTLGAKADPHEQRIRVDGTLLSLPRREYFLVNKPTGVVSTNRDPAGRPRVIDLVPSSERLFTVGRLDLSSEGLILVTNDGELANRLSHPRYGVEKTYQVEVAGQIDRDQLARLRKGARLAEGFARVVSARIKHTYHQSTLLEIVLAEGRNREIRRILARVGHKVLRLKRVALGPLRLADLPPGAVRPLAREEVQQLRAAAGQIAQRAKRSKPKPKLAKPANKKPPKQRTVIGGGPSRPNITGTGMPKRKPAHSHRQSSAKARRS
jgi:23S rRNA pseudouridine2605 synthase